MYDLCLINPPRPYLAQPDVQASLALMSLAAAAEHERLDVCICNLASDPGQPIPKAGVYGITGTYLDADTVAQLALDWGDNGRVVVGGPLALSWREGAPEGVDAVFLGEGEDSLQSIMDGSVLGFVHAHPIDVAQCPAPARHLWPGSHGGAIFCDEQPFDGESTVMLTSRGCPFSCAFCASAALVPRKLRCREPAHVVAELERCVTELGIRMFRVSDEHVTASRDHIEGVCRAIINSRTLGYGSGIAWRASAGVRPHDADLFRLMRAAGCREIAFGVESADPAVLDRLDCRKGSVPQAYAALRNARQAGMTTRALLMVGLPGESARTLEANRRFFDTAAADRLAIAVFHPVPGSALGERPEAFGCRIRSDVTDSGLCLFGPHGLHRIEPMIETGDLPIDEHRQIMFAMLLAAAETGKLGHPRRGP